MAFALVLATAMVSASAAVAGAARPHAKAPSDLTSAQVCAIVDKSLVDSTFGVNSNVVTKASPTASCEYAWATAPNAQTAEFLDVAVPAATELKGEAGAAAYKRLLSQYGSSGAKFEPLKGTGAKAQLSMLPGGGGVIALTKDGRVIKIEGSTLNATTAKALLKAVLAKLPKS